MSRKFVTLDLTISEIADIIHVLKYVDSMEDSQANSSLTAEIEKQACTVTEGKSA